MDEKLIGFLYILLRDHLPAGEVETILLQHVQRIGSGPATYSNQHLHAYAVELATRLR